jgi:hypothetical protein
MISRLLFLLVSVLALGACHRRLPEGTRGPKASAFQNSVQTRAAFDLSCPAEQLVVTELNASTFGAVGCGKKASYNCLCMFYSWGRCTKPVCSADVVSADPAPR